jgi:hypothetical protein
MYEDLDNIKISAMFQDKTTIEYIDTDVDIDMRPIFKVVTCIKCGSLVAIINQKIHEDFHSQLKQIVI